LPNGSECYEATRPVRDKYGSKWTALIKRIEETR
jgi:hypothetical protein